MYQLLLNPECQRKYQFNMSNKNRILKVHTIGVRGGCGRKEEGEGVCVVGGRRGWVCGQSEGKVGVWWEWRGRLVWLVWWEGGRRTSYVDSGKQEDELEARKGVRCKVCDKIGRCAESEGEVKGRSKLAGDMRMRDGYVVRG